MTNLKRMVLQSFKRLHRARNKVFSGDKKALIAARIKINDEFQKNKYITDEAAIQAMIKFAADVENELLTKVIQITEIKPGVFRAHISEDTMKLDNIPFNNKAIPDEGISSGKPCFENEGYKK